MQLLIHTTTPMKTFLMVVVWLLIGITMAPAQDTKFPDANQYSKSKFTYKIIKSQNHTYCYDIYSDGRLMIHQPSAPGLPGNEGFKTKADAEKVARLVIRKIKKGEMPPSITPEELKKLKVI